MTIKQKIIATANHNGLIFYKEGVFYKLYNEHAMLYYENISAFKVSVKFYKNINQLVYSVGFPVSSFNPAILGNNVQLVKSENKIVISDYTFKTTPDFNSWKTQFKTLPNKTVLKKEEESLSSMLGNYEKLKQQVLSIQLMHNTPLQVMQQLSKLQIELS
jgi:hypothetical protein